MSALDTLRNIATYWYDIFSSLYYYCYYYTYLVSPVSGKVKLPAVRKDIMGNRPMADTSYGVLWSVLSSRKPQEPARLGRTAAPPPPWRHSVGCQRLLLVKWGPHPAAPPSQWQSWWRSSTDCLEVKRGRGEERENRQVRMRELKGERERHGGRRRHELRHKYNNKAYNINRQVVDYSLIIGIFFFFVSKM